MTNQSPAKPPHIILNSEQIEQRLPHAGKMSLLHAVIKADHKSLTALAHSHLDSENPLRVDGTIATVNGIEYAAQAMAVHGALASASTTPQPGYIATVRNIDIAIPVIPEISAPLLIQVEQLMSDNNGFSYQFEIHCEQQRLISGRITVFLSPEQD